MTTGSKKWQFWLDTRVGGLMAWRLCWGDREARKDHTHISISAVILLGLLLWLGIHLLACTSDPVNPEVPKFQKRSDGSTYVVGGDGCEYDLKDNGTMKKHDPYCGTSNNGPNNGPQG